jgi:uncharacterized membrane protein (UPF0127 family)
MNYKKIFYFTIVVVFILCLFFILKKNVPARGIQYIKIAGQTIKVDLALTPATQAQGLSGRINLPEGNGMLFIFSKPDRYSFWMKDMNFPIDMIWLDQNRQVVYIEKDAQPTSYPATFTPNTDAEYVLEVPAGFAEKNNLEEGDHTEFLP